MKETQEQLQRRNDLDNGGKLKFKKLCKKFNLEFEEMLERFADYDFLLFYKGKKFIVEVKDRDAIYANYDSIMFEDEKYQKLIKDIEKEQVNGAYYITFINNLAYIYFIPLIIPYKKCKINANKKTYMSDEKIEKEVFFLPKNDLKIIEI